ncbi:MAG TPA: PEP/pyruvate-binding domain-containing protein [Candidatus Binatia bacterium]|nr:PEP/pyruvate-binding domain-containing protein [Candidatus Binatia bacterium]
MNAHARAVAPMFKSYACFLADAADPRSVGGKAYSLGEMSRLGFPVPPGFVLSDDAFQEFLDHNDFRRAIKTMCENLDPACTDRLRQTSQAVRALIRSGKIPVGIRDEIALWRARVLPGATLIVRSSAVGEDSGEASFAGQLDSFLNIDSSEELEQALLSCWSSYWSERSLFYQLARRVQLRGMGVVIQQMVRSRISGVLFTQPPARSAKDDDRLVVEYCCGYGEALVSGRVNPGRFTISRTDLTWKRETSPDQPCDPKDEALLFGNDLIARLAETGMKLEKQFRGAQDIEWTVDESGQLFIVQSRPITASATLGSQSPSGRPLVIWSNANVNENFPEPISPLLYSIASAGYYHYFRNLGAGFGIARRRLWAMEHQLRNIIGVHFGRMYYNLSNIHWALRSVPFGELWVDDFNNFVGTKKTGEPSDAGRKRRERRRGRPAEWLELCFMALKTLKQYLSLSKGVETFERIVSEYSERTRPERLQERSLNDLLTDFRGFLEIRFHRWNHAALADAASMVSYGMLKRFINREFPESDEASLHNTLLKGLRDVVSSVPALKIWELSRRVQEDPALKFLFRTKESAAIASALYENEEFSEFRRELSDFVEHWGFRISGELMLTVPSFQENPIDLLDLIKGYIEVEGASPAEVIRRQDADRAAKTAEILSILSKRKWLTLVPFVSKAQIARTLLRWTHRSIALRERARLKQALLYSRCRRIALVIGERMVTLGYLTNRDDVFFLTYQDLDQLLSGGAMFPDQTRELAAMRKREHARFSTLSPPDTVEITAGVYLPMPNGSPVERDEQRNSLGSAKLAGTSACGGQTTGRATILRDISESRRLKPGDVLVARQTDPGWGPLFFLIRGLVLERGGMLSHGAIIAREFGIPSLVGVENATERIPQGKTVCVDGDNGLVTIVD